MTFKTRQHLWMNTALIASTGAVLSSFAIDGTEGMIYTLLYSALGIAALYAGYLRDDESVSTEVPE